jgi:predicted Zn finger-like uncharacterized protein
MSQVRRAVNFHGFRSVNETPLASGDDLEPSPPMRLICPSCQTPYEIAADALGEAGRSVRCARCRTAWFAPAPTPEFAATVEWDDHPDAPTADIHWAEQAGGSIGRGTDIALASAAGPDVDAHDYTAAEAPPLVPAAEWGAAPEPDAADAPHEDVETVAVRRAPGRAERRRWPSRLRPSVPLVILGLTAILAALIAWRTEVVRSAPQTASLFARVGLPVNLRGLAFDAVKTVGETHEGVPVLVVDGVIANVAKMPVEVPRMRFALRNQAGVEVYTWTALPTRPFLSEGETLPFRTRVASPPANVHDVQVRFFNRRDLETGR